MISGSDIELPIWVLDHVRKSAAIVFGRLLSWAPKFSEGPANCRWIQGTVSRLARELGMSRNTIKRCKAELVTARLIRVAEGEVLFLHPETGCPASRDQVKRFGDGQFLIISPQVAAMKLPASSKLLLAIYDRACHLNEGRCSYKTSTLAKILHLKGTNARTRHIDRIRAPLEAAGLVSAELTMGATVVTLTSDDKPSRKPKPKPTRIERPKPDQLRNLEQAWREEFRAAHPDIPFSVWDGRQFAQVKHLLELYDATDVEEGIRHLIHNWTDIHKAFHLKGSGQVPSIGVLAKLHDVLIPEAQRLERNRAEMQSVSF